MDSPFFHHLGTNYTPADGEAQTIRDIVETNLNAADAIDRAVAALLEKRAAHIDSASRHSALLEPIRKVPDDVLSLIFQAYLADAGVIPVTRRHPAVVASHVCRRWRQLAISTPSLWAGTHLLLPQYPTRYLPTGGLLQPVVLSDAVARWETIADRIFIAAQVSIARSRQHSLDVTLSAPAFTEVAELPRIYPRVTKWFSLLCSEAHRWRHAQFDTHFTDAPQNIAGALEPFLTLKAEKLPVLESLRLQEFVRLEPFTPPGPDGLVLHPGLEIFQAPSLRALQLGGISHKWDTLPVRWSNLTRLQLSSYRGHSFHSRIHSSSIGPSTAFSLLRQCRSLVSCDLNIDFHEPSSVYRHLLAQTAHLPNLHSLVIRDKIPGTEFVRALDVPSLRNIQFTQPLSYMDPAEHHAASASSASGDNDLECPALAWLQILGDQLHFVALDIYWLGLDMLLLLLQSLKAVSYLRLKYSKDHSPGSFSDPCLVIDNLTLPPRGVDGGPILCPNLRRFHFDVTGQPGSVTEEGVLQMIASRRSTIGVAYPDRECGVATLEEVTMLFGSFQTMNILEELRTRNVDTTGFRLGVSYPSPIPLVPHRLNLSRD